MSSPGLKTNVIKFWTRLEDCTAISAPAMEAVKSGYKGLQRYLDEREIEKEQTIDHTDGQEGVGGAVKERNEGGVTIHKSRLRQTSEISGVLEEEFKRLLPHRRRQLDSTSAWCSREPLERIFRHAHSIGSTPA
jgi:hypothetical protein